MTANNGPPTGSPSATTNPRAPRVAILIRAEMLLLLTDAEGLHQQGPQRSRAPSSLQEVSSSKP